MTFISDSEIDRIKVENTPLDVAVRYGLEPRRQGAHHVALCPFHNEKTPSFFIRAEDRPGQAAFKCFGCGWSGDVIRFFQCLESIGFKTACERLGARADESPQCAENRAQRARERQQRQRQAEAQELARKGKQRQQWPTFHFGRTATLQEVADLRGVSLNAVEMAQGSAVLRFCEWRGHRAWVIGDSRRTCAQVRRLDGEPWANGAKAWTLPGSQLIPIGLTDHVFPIILVEGGADLLAAWHLVCKQSRILQPVAMLGTGARFGSYAKWLRNREVWICPDNDEPGRKAAERWAREALDAGAAHVARLVLPKGVNDLNEEVAA